MLPVDLFPQFGLGVLVYDLLRRPPSRVPEDHYRGRGIIDACVHSGTRRSDWLYGAIIAGELRDLSDHLRHAWCGSHRMTDGSARLAPVRILGLIGLFSYSLYLDALHFRRDPRISYFTSFIRAADPMCNWLRPSSLRW